MGKSGRAKTLGLILLLAFLCSSSVMAAEISEDKEIVDISDHIYSYTEMMEDIEQLGEKYPDRIQVSSVGTSLDDRMIFQIVLGNPNAPKAIYVQSSIHAREWMNTWIMMKSLEMNLQNWNTVLPNGETYGQIFNDCCVYLLPMVNPDGVTISQFGFDGIQNEALRNYGLSLKGASNPQRWKANARGVDLNRQFSVGWNSNVTEIAPCSDTYNGVAPFTEPEAVAVKNALEQREFVAAITYHTMEGAIYWNLGQQGDVLFRNQILANQCQAISGYRLDPGPSDLKGLEYNYMIFEKGIPTVCIETGRKFSPLPYSEWDSVWRENSMMMVVVAASY